MSPWSDGGRRARLPDAPPAEEDEAPEPPGFPEQEETPEPPEEEEVPEQTTPPAVASVDGHGRVDNAFTGSARGAGGDLLTFGTDMVRFNSILGRETGIRILSEQDAVMVDAVALTAPMRT